MTMMQEKKRALGRGLESLIPAGRPAAGPAAAKESGETVQELALEAIEPNPYQPRRHLDEYALAELAASIRAQGVLQPIVVRYISPELPHPVSPTAGETRVGHPVGGQLSGSREHPHPVSPTAGETRVGHPAPQSQAKYQLIAGERRWLASKKAGKATIPALVRQVTNEEAMLLALIENIQREDLQPMELAHAFQQLSRQFGLTQEEMAARTGKDRASVSNYLRMLKLPEEVQAAIGRGELSFGHAKELMSLEDPVVLSAAAQKMVKEHMSVRQAELLVNELVYLGPMAGKKQQKPPRPEDPNVRAARMELEGRLGCRVKIFDHQGRGKVVIEYKSLEDFDRIVEALK
jgi:ParB family chromosome partitioning protein